MTYQDQDAPTPVSAQKPPGKTISQRAKPKPTPPEPKTAAAPVAVPSRRLRVRPWTLVWLVLLLASGGAMGGAFWLLTALPPPPECQATDRAMEPAERLTCAQQAAASGKLKDLVAGVKLAQNWPRDDARYRASQQLLANWSSSILLLAREQASQNQLRDAITIANNIPRVSPVYLEAQAAIALWQRDLDRGQAIYDRAQAALKAQDWRRANEELQALIRLPNPSWRSRIGVLRQQIQAERTARIRLQEARNLAQSGNPEALEQAIQVAQTIGRDRYARPEAQAEIGRWSRTLLNLALDQLQQQNFAAARALAASIPTQSNVGSEAQTVFQISQAQEIVAQPEADPLQVEEQWLALLQAVHTARRLPGDAPLTQQVKVLLPAWQANLQDLNQLQVANTLASLDQPGMLQLAIDQANRIPPERPRRLQAQTLVSHWRKEIQRLEDRPLLQQATTQARAGTPQSLQAAIAKASKIAPGRALRLEAQAAIARWQNQLETLQGRPAEPESR